MRPQLLTQAIEARKHVYCEKPTAPTLGEATEVARLAARKRVKNGVVQDKLFLPGLVKLRRLREAGFFGRILSVRGDFGYWVLEGDEQPAQRPSWNYRAKDGGGIILDMLCHWRYVLDRVVAPVRSVSCLGATHIRKRWDENNEPYDADADDAAYATLELEGGAVVQINSSWCTRVYRDDLVVFQIDGTEGSAVAGLTRCLAQSKRDTPRPVWNPDEPQAVDFRAGWDEVGIDKQYDNGFKVQWEMFLRHVCEDVPFPYTLIDGARGVQLAEAALQSWRERRWIDLEPLEP
jgi:predicted dehydrogenase